MKDLVAVGKGGKVRTSDAELHRAAHKALWEANHIVFDSLTGLIRQIIANETWRAFGHTNFANYALDASTNGLGVNTNQRLWILRCSMDVYGDHIGEWAGLLEAVEAMVRLEPSRPEARSLELLAKDSPDASVKITYLPSRQSSHDGHLVRLRKSDSSAYRRVLSGKAALADVLREKRSKSVRQNDVLAYLRYHWNRASAAERKKFISWLRDQGEL